MRARGACICAIDHAKLMQPALRNLYNIRLRNGGLVNREGTLQLGKSSDLLPPFKALNDSEASPVLRFSYIDGSVLICQEHVMTRNCNPMHATCAVWHVAFDRQFCCVNVPEQSGSLSQLQSPCHGCSQGSFSNSLCSPTHTASFAACVRFRVSIGYKLRMHYSCVIMTGLHSNALSHPLLS